MTTYIFYYYISINALSFLISALDKLKAKKNKWRVKEKTLHIFSFLGGVYGSILFMIIFRHKTKKMKFKIITAIAFLINTAIIGYWLYLKYFPSS